MKVNEQTIWKKLVEKITVASVILVPSLILVLISSLYDMYLQNLVPMVVGSSILLFFEVIAVQNQKRFIWAVISTSIRDKLTFATCLAVAWITSGLATYFKGDSWWFGLLILLLGFGLASVLFTLFMSKEAKTELRNPK